MKKFMLFVGGLVALIILLANLGPMVLLALSVWLLYVVFKKFVKSNSTAGKVGWVIVGLILLSIALSNIFAVIGLVAAYALYLIYSSWKKDNRDPVVHVVNDDDPFTNFERQWSEINN
ncbi:lia operon protein LiaI [Virgibacillus natechei]|uniref:Lia operon protein LiaI n=1 Tax=Virgibacillus natechei TaxID=1216297 RepID=A0ABS4IEX0_9BACI|nr:flagellar basal body rod protein [Virgibacillus natechei]MBP1969477.1 lia operon protein LiaI [Virgibacillus natechei]UZD11818.1 flagellar basal body rod protein [Virgibacillus natechei]